MRMYPRLVMNSTVGGFFRDVPAAFGTRKKSSKLSMGKIQAGS